MNIYKEPIKNIRFGEVRKIIKSLIKKTQYPDTECLLINNTLILSVLDTLLYRIDLKGYPDNPYSTTYFTADKIMEFDDADSGIMMRHADAKIFEYLNIYLDSNLKKIAELRNCRDNKEFEDLLSLKNADGLKWFVIKDEPFGVCYKIPMFAGLLPINKGDSIDIEIYKFDNMHSIVRNIIFKKKLNNNIEIYYKTINLI